MRPEVSIPLLTTTCPHAWQKHFLPANQNSKFRQSNFKVYPPSLERFGATPFRESKWISNAFGHFVFGVLKIRMNETPVFHLDAYSTLQWKNTNRYILPFGGPANCLISFMTFFFNTTALTAISKREICVSYPGRGFLKFFALSICFLTFRLKCLLIFLDEPFTWVFTTACRRKNRRSFSVLDTRLRLISFGPMWRSFFVHCYLLSTFSSAKAASLILAEPKNHV